MPDSRHGERNRPAAASGFCLILLLAAMSIPTLSMPSCQKDSPRERTVYAELEAPVGEAAARPAATAPARTGPDQVVAPVRVPAFLPASAPATKPTVASTAPTTQKIAQPEVVAASIMQVNDKFITLQQVFHPIRRQLQSAAAISESEEEFRRRATDMIGRQVREQIEQEVLFAEAQKRLMEEEKKIVQDQIDDHARRVIAQVGSKSLFEEQLKKESTDYPTWVADLTRSIMVDAYVHQRFRAKVNIDRLMMLKYYNSHLKQYRRGQQIQMQVISSSFMSFMSATQPDTIDTRGKVVAEAHRHIVAAQEALQKGEDFGEVAKKFDRGPMAGKGGVWPMMERGSFKAGEVEEAALKQPVGKVSGVVESIHGFYIVKTLSVQGGDTQSFDKVQKEIETELRREQYRTLTQDYLKELQKNTVIRGSEEAGRIAVEAAVKQFWNK